MSLIVCEFLCFPVESSVLTALDSVGRHPSTLSMCANEGNECLHLIFCEKSNLQVDIRADNRFQVWTGFCLL